MAFTDIREEWAVVSAEGQPPLGAVRRIRDGRVTAMIENFGEFDLEPAHVAAAHDGKVVLALDTLPGRLLDAVGHAHDAERPDEVVNPD